MRAAYLFTTATVAFLAAIVFVAPTARAAESLGEPCRAFNVLAGRVVTDPAGTEWFVLTNMNEASGMELVFIDPKTNAAKAYKAPAGAGAWALLQVPGDRLVVGTYYDGTFMVFDLKKMEFVKSAKFKGEEYIWNLALGSDGRVYGGTYRGGKLGALDLETNEVEDLGRPTEAEPNLYLRNVSSTPDGRILCNWGTAKKVTMLFDPKTKKFSEVPPHLNVDKGVTWGEWFIAGRQVMTGPDLKQIKPPFPVPTGAKSEDGKEVPWSVDVLATTKDVLVMRQGDAIYRYRRGYKAPQKVYEGDLRGGVIYGATKAGDLLGVRGPEYFVLSPGKDVEFRRIPVEPGPRKTHFLEYDEQRHRLWGGPTFGQTIFWLDVAGKKFENTAKVCDAGGEVYHAAFLDGIVYLVAYAGGDVIAYNPDQPWDQWGNVNPRTIASVKQMGKGYIRPVAGVKVGPDKKLYAGWMVGYGTYGGAVSVTDPKTGETELIENPLGVEQCVSGVAVDDAGRLYVGTYLGANGLPTKPGESPKFGVYDRAAKKVLFEKTFDGASSVNNFHYDPKAKRVVFAVDNVIHLFDTESQQLVEGVDVPKVTGPYNMSGRGEGRVYYANDKQLHVLNLSTGKATPYAEAPGKVDTVAAGAKGEVYVSVGTEIHKLTPRPTNAAP